MLDITIDMDVESQPGPVTDRSLGGVNKNYLTLMRTKLAPFERSGLLSLRNNAFKPSPAVLLSVQVTRHSEVPWATRGWKFTICLYQENPGVARPPFRHGKRSES